MRIGFLGNTNNFPFMLARAFKRMGHEITFVVTRSDQLHRPEFRYADISYPYPEWIREIVFPNEAAYVTGSAQQVSAIELLRQCDLVVLNDLGVSLAGLIQRPYLALLTGSDLAYYCNPSSEMRVLSAMTTRNPLKRFYGKWIWKRILRRQRAAVRQAPLIFHFERGLIPASDELLDEIGVVDRQRLFFLMADVKEIPVSAPAMQTRFRTFCASRLTWKLPMLPGDSPLDFKGSDVMIRGLGLYWKKYGDPIDIQLVRKGRHVTETEALVNTEGISHLVTWHEEMTQAEVWRQYALADVVFEQFGNGLVTMAGLEAMAAGRPVIANGRPDILEPLVGEESPICQALTPEDVCEHLRRLVQNRDAIRELGIKSRDWVVRHFSPEIAATRILERMAPHLTTVLGSQATRTR